MPTLLCLMHHRVGTGKHANSLPILKDHLAHIQRNYHVVLPGDPLDKKRLNICLVFDDATFDFYHFVYPLLQAFQLRALLGVPTNYILDSTTLLPQKRLAVPYSLMMQEGIFEKEVPFCTWEELKMMVQSGFVEVASHSHLHPNLTFSFVDLNRELNLSKAILEKKVDQHVSSFIYPFGRWNDRVHKAVSSLYPFSFRIGTGANFNWDANKAPLRRIPADRLEQIGSPFTLKKQLFYKVKTFLDI